MPQFKAITSSLKIKVDDQDFFSEDLIALLARLLKLLPDFYA